MSKIFLLANSDDMYDVAKAAVQHTGADIQIEITHTYEDSVKLAAENVKNDYRIVIARGAHARAIRESNLGVTVIAIPFTGNNIVALLTRAKNEWGEFAVVGNPTMIQMTRELERPLGAKPAYYEVHQWPDINTIVNKIRDSGIKAIVGGYDACSAARAIGLHDYCIKTSEYEIVTAIMDAKSLMVSLERDRYWDTIFRSTLDTISDGVIVADTNGAICHANRRALKLFGNNGVLKSLPTSELSGLLRRSAESRMPVYDEIIDVNERSFSVSCVPMRNTDDNIAIIFQETEYVHKIERKIRQKLANKGLVAKQSFESITANGTSMQEAVRIAKTYATVDSTILISGETGTGKEVFAQSIHNFSRRADEPFVAVNCATIPANLLESELFGYAEGAFTGAKKGGKVGLFELAHKGTIFLDEIGETSLDMQARLLRVLEEHEIMRIGDDKVIPVDIRVIAASNRDLQKLIEEGKFRSDFYYRLDVLSLRLPPLRENKENIMPLMERYAERYARKNNRIIPAFDAESIDLLANYRWPGNVRELKNVAERLVVTNNKDIIEGDDIRKALQLEPKPQRPVIGTVVEKVPCAAQTGASGLLNDAERRLIKQVLADCAGNKTAAAKKLGISRPTLNKKLHMMEVDGAENI